MIISYYHTIILSYYDIIKNPDSEALDNSTLFLENVTGQKFEIAENEENLNFVISLSKKSFKIEFNTFNFVKFHSRLVLFPSIFQFQNSFVPKKLFLCFCDNFVKIYCQNFAKTG